MKEGNGKRVLVDPREGETTHVSEVRDKEVHVLASGSLFGRGWSDNMNFSVMICLEVVLESVFLSQPVKPAEVGGIEVSNKDIKDTLDAVVEDPIRMEDVGGCMNVLDVTGDEPLDDMVDSTPDVKDVLVNNRVLKGTLMGFLRRKNCWSSMGQVVEDKQH